MGRMSAKFQPVGIVRLQPCVSNRFAGPCDDSTLELLLASLAHRHCLVDTSIPRVQSTRHVATRRLNWPASTDVDVSLRANTIQLIHDLQAEFDRVESIPL
jgi:hypothetical protein